MERISTVGLGLSGRGNVCRKRMDRSSVDPAPKLD